MPVVDLLWWNKKCCIICCDDLLTEGTHLPVAVAIHKRAHNLSPTDSAKRAGCCHPDFVGQTSVVSKRANGHILNKECLRSPIRMRCSVLLAMLVRM